MGIFKNIKNLFKKEIETEKLEQDNNKEEKIKQEVNINEEISKLEETESKEIEVQNDIKLYDKGLSKTRDNFVNKLINLNKRTKKITDEYFEELEDILIMADIGVNTVLSFIERLKKRVKTENITDLDYLQEVIVDELFVIYVNNSILTNKIKFNPTGPTVLLFVGVNGVGKTTSIGKLASQFKNNGKKVVLAAADTFRAAAADQLKEWANRANVDIVMGAEGSDPGSVLYDAISSAKNKNADILLCDTAGRLHNKKNLMEELKKLDRIIEKEYNGCRRENFIVLDATTGQNALAQARQFKECTDITGVILTKMDGSAKGGIAIAIQSELGIPVKYIGVGEQIDDLQKFDSHQFVEALFEENGEDITSDIELGE